jgi:hypothetical protein
VALVGGNTIHEVEFVAMGANKSLSDRVWSTFSALGCSSCSTFTLGFPAMLSPISEIVLRSIGVLRFFLNTLSRFGSKGKNSKFKDLRPSIHNKTKKQKNKQKKIIKKKKKNKQDREKKLQVG